MDHVQRCYNRQCDLEHHEQYSLTDVQELHTPQDWPEP